MDVTSVEYKKAVWHSRRGMLELDELLVPFAKEVFLSLNEEEKQVYIRFISNEDPVLFQWLIEHAHPKSSLFRQIIQKIKAHAATRCRN